MSSVIILAFAVFSNLKVATPSLLQIIEIPDESEKSPVLEKKEGEVESIAAKEEKEKETGNGDEGKEKEAEDASKEKEEKEKTPETDRDSPAEVKGEGLETKTESEEDKVKGEPGVQTVFSLCLVSFVFCLSDSFSLCFS